VTRVAAALNVVMAAMDKPLWSLQETKERVRLSLRESFPVHFGDRWEEARRIYLDVFRAIHLDRLSPLPGCGDLLQGLADAGCQAADGPAFERYDEQFDGRTGLGGLEIWVPAFQKTSFTPS